MADFLEWVSHGVKRGRFGGESRTTVTVFVATAALTLVAVLYLVLVSRTAAQGRYIEELQGEILRVQRENQQLAVQIAERGAMPSVLERARVLGFVPAEQVEFLTSSD